MRPANPIRIFVRINAALRVDEGSRTTVGIPKSGCVVLIMSAKRTATVISSKKKRTPKTFGATKGRRLGCGWKTPLIQPNMVTAMNRNYTASKVVINPGESYHALRSQVLGPAKCMRVTLPSSKLMAIFSGPFSSWKRLGAISPYLLVLP